MTAFELCGIYNGYNFRLKNGRVVWEHIRYIDRTDKCVISRYVEVKLRHANKSVLVIRKQYISADKRVQVVGYTYENFRELARLGSMGVILKAIDRFALADECEKLEGPKTDHEIAAMNDKEIGEYYLKYKK